MSIQQKPIYIVNILMKSGNRICTPLTLCSASQLSDGTTIKDMEYAQVPHATFIQLSAKRPELEWIKNIDKRQVEAITIKETIHEVN